jgi:N-acetylmuramoyl-L-alanine amidase
MKAVTIGSDGWLEEGVGVKHQLTPNTGGRFAAGQPDTLVIHFTGGRSAQSSADWLCWHAGRSSWQGRSGLNAYSLGIEIDNAGPLEAREDGYYTWFGTRIPEAQVLHATHRHADTPSYWQTYTEKQIETVEYLCERLMETYDIDTLVGHEEISPGRKVDPGPAFPLDPLRERLILGDRSEQTEATLPEQSKRALVTADQLNIRSLPNITSPTVTAPLKRGTLVKIEEEQAGWYKVKVETEGWVKKEFLTSTNRL